MNRLIILSNYFKPGFRAGGPVKSLDLLCTNLKYDYEILVLTSAFDIGSDQAYKDLQLDKPISKEGYKIIYFSKYNVWNILHSIKKYKPNLIYLNSFFSTQNIIIIALNKFMRFPKIILSPRGEISLNALKIKKYKKQIVLFIYKSLNLFKGIDLHATDKFEGNFLKKILPGNDITTIPNFTSELKEPTKQLKKQGNINMCFVSRITKKKNLEYALKVLSSNKLNNITIYFDIWGPIEDSAYWHQCLMQIKNLPENIHVAYKGSFKPSEQVNSLSDYELFFLPTLNENFGHIIFETMQLGIVPLISNNTPWTSINEFGGGSFPLEAKEKFEEYLLTFAKLDNEKFSNLSNMTVQYAKQNTNNCNNKEKYISFFNEKSK
jgi:glycosyltransferase involved in cell wall biosynthesis